MQTTNYWKLKERELNSKTDATLKKYGAFFAFSEEQLKEGMEKAGVVDRSELMSTSMGMIVAKKHYPKLAKELSNNTVWFINEVKRKCNPKEVILYELNNHEAFYTRDIEDAYRVLKSYGYSREMVEEVLHRPKSKNNIT